MQHNDALWRLVAGLEGRTVTTVRGRPFLVHSVSTDSVRVLVGPHHRQRSLDRSMLEEADTLPRTGGMLNPQSVRSAGLTEYDPAYVAGIINKVRATAA